MRFCNKNVSNSIQRLCPDLTQYAQLCPQFLASRKLLLRLIKSEDFLSSLFRRFIVLECCKYVSLYKSGFQINMENNHDRYYNRQQKFLFKVLPNDNG